MKNIHKAFLGLIILALVGAVGMLQVSSQSWLGANLLAQNNAGIRFVPVEQELTDPEDVVLEDTLLVQTHQQTPQSPDFLNSFNIYAGGVSELALLEKFKDDIKGEFGRAQTFYLTEAVDYVRKLSPRKEFFGDKLPLWPETTIATYGNVVAYLFPNEPNPKLFAQAIGVMPLEAESHNYLSYRELMEGILKPLFFSADADVVSLLVETGLFNDEAKGRSETKEGILLVEAIRLIRDIRELIERQNIQASKAEHRSYLVPLETHGLVLDQKTEDILLRAFMTEFNPEEANPEIDERIRTSFSEKVSSMHGQKLSSDLITELRHQFVKSTPYPNQPIYELPSMQLVGSCQNLHRKTYMGPVAVTGPLGATIICDQMMFRFPANAYLINVFSLPKLEVLHDNAIPGRTVVRSDVMRSYENSFIVNEIEQNLIMIYRPEGIEDRAGEDFVARISDHQGENEQTLRKKYAESGAVISLLLRSITGDNRILFDQ